MKIQFKDKEIELKYSFRINMMFENAVGESFTGQKGVTESIFFFYCTLVTSAKDYSITLEEVIDWLDENPNILVEFGSWLTQVLTNQSNVKKNSVSKTKKTTKK